MNYIEIDVKDNKLITLMTQMPHKIWLIMFMMFIIWMKIIILVKFTTWMMNNITWKNYIHEWKWFLSIYGVSYCEVYIYLNYSSQVSKLFVIINLHSCLLELNFKTNHFQPILLFLHILCTFHNGPKNKKSMKIWSFSFDVTHKFVI
jgi:hypothetical protein